MPDTRVERDDTPPPPPPPPPERPREVDALRPVPNWEEPGRPPRTPERADGGERAPAAADRRPEPDALKEVPQHLDTPARIPPEVDAERAVPGASGQRLVDTTEEPARPSAAEWASAQRVEAIDVSVPQRAVAGAEVDAERAAPDSLNAQRAEHTDDADRTPGPAAPESLNPQRVEPLDDQARSRERVAPEASDQPPVSTFDEVALAPERPAASPSDVVEPPAEDGRARLATALDGVAPPGADGKPVRAPEADVERREAPDETAPVEFATNEAGAAYGQAVWGEAAAGLGAGEADAFRDWSSETGPVTYREINGSLRGLEAPTPAVREQIDRLDAGLTRQPVPEDLVVTRQVGSAAAFGQSPEQTKGTIQADAGYLATTLGPRGLDHPDADTLIRLHVPAGSEAMYMGSLSEFPSETELLLARDARYAVDDVKWDDDLDLWVVDATLLPREAR